MALSHAPHHMRATGTVLPGQTSLFQAEAAEPIHLSQFKQLRCGRRWSLKAGGHGTVQMPETLWADPGPGGGTQKARGGSEG